MTNNISVREITIDDIPFITDYWLNASAEYLHGMGADIEKIPDRAYWEEALNKQIQQDYPEKQSYCMIWLLDGKPVGHCNVNQIKFGEEAFMHLHMWNSSDRKKGLGTQFVKMCMPHFFQNLQLKTLYCEPSAMNQGPNKLLQTLGFELEKEYLTTPGFICFEQTVKRWKLSGIKSKV